jgi:uncharacterized OB-fold protein
MPPSSAAGRPPAPDRSTPVADRSVTVADGSTPVADPSTSATGQPASIADHGAPIPDRSTPTIDGPAPLGAAAVALADGPPIRLLPRPDAESAFFWASGADGQLRFLHCEDCRRWHHPPGPVCPWCLGRRLVPTPVSGRGTVHAFTVNHQQWIPGSAPYVVALVTIDDQPDIRLTTNLVDVGDQTIRIGMAVSVRFVPAGDGIWLPCFAPLASATDAVVS